LNRAAPLSDEALTLLRDTLATAAPQLLPVVEKLERGDQLRDDEADALEDVLADEMTADYSEEEGLTQRGRELDNLIGVVRQQAESFFGTDAS
jgi:hypothetical protein